MHIVFFDKAMRALEPGPVICHKEDVSPLTCIRNVFPTEYL